MSKTTSVACSNLWQISTANFFDPNVISLSPPPSIFWGPFSLLQGVSCCFRFAPGSGQWERSPSRILNVLERPITNPRSPFRHHYRLIRCLATRYFLPMLCEVYEKIVVARRFRCVVQFAFLRHLLGRFVKHSLDLPRPRSLVLMDPHP